MSNATAETTEAVLPWIKWSWRHYVMHMDDYPSFEAAVEAAVYASDCGDEAFACIEGPDGVVSQEDVDARWHEIDERNAARWRAEAQAQSPMTHRVELDAPVKDARSTVTLSWHRSAAEAEAAAEPLRARFGDRVRVEAKA